MSSCELLQVQLVRGGGAGRAEQVEEGGRGGRGGGRVEQVGEGGRDVSDAKAPETLVGFLWSWGEGGPAKRSQVKKVTPLLMWDPAKKSDLCDWCK